MAGELGENLLEKFKRNTCNNEQTMVIDLRIIFSPDENKRLMEKIRNERIDNLNLYVKRKLLEVNAQKVFGKSDER